MTTLQEEEDKKELEKLRTFYKKVAHATMNHDVLTVPDPEDALSDESYAVVYPATLSKLLEEVNPRWYYTAFDPLKVSSDTHGS